MRKIQINRTRDNTYMIELVDNNIIINMFEKVEKSMKVKESKIDKEGTKNQYSLNFQKQTIERV